MTDSLSTQEIRRLYRVAGRDPARGHQVRRLDAGRRAVRRPQRQARRVPGAPQGLRPREAALPPLPRTRSPRPSSTAAPPTTARSARSESADERRGHGAPLGSARVCRTRSFGIDGRSIRPQRSKRVPEDARPEGVQVLRRHHHARPRARRHRGGRARTAAASRTSSTPSAGCSAPRRPSAVRSQKMDDVIFAGTAKRQALGRAEVEPHHRQRRRACCRSSSPRSRSPARCSAPATASTPSTACRAGCSTSRSCCPTPASAASST